MEGWVGLVGWPIADALPTKWSHVNHRSGTYQGKSASQRPTPLPLSHSANRHVSSWPALGEGCQPHIASPVFHFMLFWTFRNNQTLKIVLFTDFIAFFVALSDLGQSSIRIQCHLRQLGICWESEHHFPEVGQVRFSRQFSGQSVQPLWNGHFQPHQVCTVVFVDKLLRASHIVLLCVDRQLAKCSRLPRLNPVNWKIGIH